jgi:ABC-type transport system substrate-binding protein
VSTRSLAFKGEAVLRSHKRTTVVTAALSVVALVATACGGGGTSAGNQAGASSDFDPNATFTWAHSVPIVSLDPHTTTNVYDYPYHFFVYDRLTYLDPKGEPKPMLAESWQVQDGGKTLEMKIRSGVTFQDGTALDAEAVKANFERMRAHPKSSVKAQLSSVTGETVVDPQTIRLNLSDASAGALPAILGGFAGAMVSPKGFDDPNLSQVGNGAGPYRVVDNKGQDGVTLEKYDKYWDPSAQKVAKVVMKAIPDDETRLNAVLTGAVDGALIRAAQEKRAEGAGLRLVSAITAAPTSLEINMKRAKFGDKRVRQAIAYALDRKEISDGAYAGTCEPAQQIFNRNYWAYAPDVGEPYNLDLDKAKALMKEAGLENGFSFDLLTNPSPAYQTTVEIIQAQLAKINIQVNIKVLPGPETTVEFWSKRAADANITVDAFALDPSVVVSTFTGPTGFRNVGDYVNPQLNDLAARATATADREERKKLYGQIIKIMLDEALQPIVLCYQKQTWAFANGTNGFVIGDAGLWDFRNVAKPKA